MYGVCEAYSGASISGNGERRYDRRMLAATTLLTAVALAAAPPPAPSRCLGLGAIDLVGTVTNIPGPLPAPFSGIQTGDQVLAAIDFIADVAGQPLPNGGIGYFSSPDLSRFLIGPTTLRSNGPSTGTAISMFETTMPSTDVLAYEGTYALFGASGRIRFEFVDAGGDLFPALDIFQIPFPLMPATQADQTAILVVEDAAGALLLEAEITLVELRLCSGDVCAGVPNSTGLPANLSFSGSAVIANNDLVLQCNWMPPGTAGFFLNSRTTGFFTNIPNSQGNLCLGGSIGRFWSQIQVADSIGRMSIPVDVTQIPTPFGPRAAQVGETWTFQAWYRDSVQGVATSNFSSASSVTFQ